MEALLKSIKAQMESFETNATAHAEKGNKAAGSRARKAALELSKALKEYRKLSVEADKK